MHSTILGLINLPTLLAFFFFFNDTATTEIYTLSLHDALPISICDIAPALRATAWAEDGVIEGAEWKDPGAPRVLAVQWQDRKSTRLNSSHSQISYAVFCLKKKK